LSQVKLETSLGTCQPSIFLDWLSEGTCQRMKSSEEQMHEMLFIDFSKCQNKHICVSLRLEWILHWTQYDNCCLNNWNWIWSVFVI
jgi:hypothetical protein